MGRILNNAHHNHVRGECIASMAETFDALMKIVIIGDTSVGKTCLVLRYTQDLFRENFLSTIGKVCMSTRVGLHELYQVALAN